MLNRTVAQIERELVQAKLNKTIWSCTANRDQGIRRVNELEQELDAAKRKNREVVAIDDDDPRLDPRELAGAHLGPQHFLS